MRTVAILQARINSSRLPGKMLLPLLGKPLVQHVIERVQRATRLDAVVLAFPSKDIDAFIPFSSQVHLYGSALDEADLVGRYLSAAAAYDADLIVRIPCDNPCVQPEMIDAAVARYLAVPSIFVSTQWWHVQERVYADGVGAEVFSLSRLKWLDHATQNSPQYREHPHLLFQDQHLIDAYEQYQRYGNVSDTLHLDVNTQQEYECIEDIYNHFGHNRFTLDEIVSYLTTQEVSNESIEREQPSGNSQQRA